MFLINKQYMKQLIVLTILLFSSTLGYSQGKYFIGVNAGISLINDNVVSTSVAGAEFDSKLAAFFPAVAGVHISDKSRVRLDLSSFRLKSKLTYNYNASQPDPSVPDYSEISIKTETVNLNYDYRVAGTEKFDIYSSAGLRALFSTNKSESTTYLDGRQEETETVIIDFNRNLFGIGGGIVAKYNYTNKIGITFTPDYAIYFGGFNKGDNYRLTRMNLAVGAEFRL